MTEYTHSTPELTQPGAPWWKRIHLGWIAGWLLVIGLFWWVLRSASLSDAWMVLMRMSGTQAAALLALNVLIAFTFGWRWWLVLRAQGYSIPYPVLASYRLICFSISYFTPGPHLGGEPLQVYLLHRRHGVPGAAATASVALDKLIEVLVNFTFLLIGVAVTLQAQIAPGAVTTEAVIAASVLLMIPVIFLGALYTGKHPIGNLIEHLPAQIQPPERMRRVIVETEILASTTCRERPDAIFLALAGSVVVWAALFFEFWGATHFLGLNLNWVQLISIITVARVAVLLPSPGGLGTLEAGQVMVMQWLGLDPAAGLGLSLLIRARDILFGIIGLLWGAWLVGSWQFLRGRQVIE